MRNASWTGAHTSIPASVAAIAAMRIISAPLACIGKFMRERGFGSRPTRRRQPNTVFISLFIIAADTVSSLHRQNGL